jgi:hypothetical protein
LPSATACARCAAPSSDNGPDHLARQPRAQGRRDRGQELSGCLKVDTLNRLVVIFLEQAELRVKDRQPLTLDYWRQNVDRLLTFNDKPILQGSGKLSNESARQIVQDRYDSFDAQRRRAEARAADAEDLKALEAVAKKGSSTS